MKNRLQEYGNYLEMAFYHFELELCKNLVPLVTVAFLKK